MCKLLAFSNMEQAFYRKYRPQNLDEMVGQDEAVALISSQISDDKIGHAYLFSGPKGVGKTSLARIIAKELGCDPIFDVSEIDAASHNKVDDIRDMNESVNFIATSPGKKRIFILDEVHMLSNAASNAFLKTLEEPPEHVIFILATTEPDRVIETIRSRTTQVVFKKILDEKIDLTATCVRLPISVSHSESVNIQFEKSFSIEKVKEALENFEGCKVIDERVDGHYSTPVEAEGKDETFISRIREDKTIKNGLNLWIVSDNLLRGAALNSVEIAETLIKNNFYGK